MIIFLYWRYSILSQKLFFVMWRSIMNLFVCRFLFGLDLFVSMLFSLGFSLNRLRIFLHRHMILVNRFFLGLDLLMFTPLGLCFDWFRVGVMCNLMIFIN